jgi:hypothetical protein
MHVSEAIGDREATGAGVRKVLRELGDPAVVAGEALRANGPRAPEPRIAWFSHEWLGIALMLTCPPVGVVLVWTSRAWSRGEKAIATFLSPVSVLVVQYGIWFYVTRAHPCGYDVLSPASGHPGTQVASDRCLPAALQHNSLIYSAGWLVAYVVTLMFLRWRFYVRRRAAALST